MVLNEFLEALLANHILHGLLKKHTRKPHLTCDTTDNQPLHTLLYLAPFILLVSSNESLYLTRNDKVQSLPLTNSSHPPCTLRVIPERHIGANRYECSCVRRLSDVLPGCVHLIVETQAPLGRNTTVCQKGAAPAVTQKHHLPVHIIKVYNTINVVQTTLKQFLRNLQVAKAGNERTSVNQSQWFKRALSHQIQNSFTGPSLLQYRRSFDDIIVGEYLEDHTVRTFTVVALAHFHRQQLRRRSRETQPDGEQHGASKFHGTGCELQCGVFHGLGEEDVAQEVLDNETVVLQQVVQHIQLLLVVNIDNIQCPYIGCTIHIFDWFEYMLIRNIAQVMVLPSGFTLRLPEATTSTQHPSVECFERLSFRQMTRFLVELLS
ncbi:hypothetical protein BOVATA_035200 [Babesia ovata]|uniref:Uncharacterized protein n=1 Tax=Babesia ovata TaxID=189622 RepID=A0A2H6KGC1_9APIC|nr:uncharacterized protein BOVATA_035200 [Babesia ovata]GBE62027.1 hypothetical protein BOVATA_035200 [Babesia ovata]